MSGAEPITVVGDDGTPLSPPELACVLVDALSAEDVLRRLAEAAVRGIEQGMAEARHRGVPS
jgi:hypothetical protein